MCVEQLFKVEVSSSLLKKMCFEHLLNRYPNVGHTSENANTGLLCYSGGLPVVFAYCL